jgi:hypothetical protein
VYATLAAFHERGGMLIATGCTPRLACEGACQDYAVQGISRRLFTDQAIGTPAGRALFYSRPGRAFLEGLVRSGVADFASDVPGVVAQHRRVGEADLYFVVNHDRYRGNRCRLLLRGSGAPVVMDPLDGAIRRPARWHREGDRVSMQVYLEENESLFVLIGPVAGLPETTGVRVDADELGVLQEIAGPWRLVIDPGDTHALRLRDLPPLPRFEELPREQTVSVLGRWEDMGLAAHSGGGTYETSFQYDEPMGDADVFVDLGEVGVAAALFLNDRSCGTRMWPPYRYRVTDALRAGENRLRVRVTNTLANAIQESYGTGKAPTAAEDWQVKQFARFADDRLRSGLMGPVRLLATRTTTG